MSGNETLLLIAAREGMGFAFVPRVIVEDDLAAGTLEHLLPTALTPSAPSTASTPTAPTCPPRCGRFWIFWWRRGGEGQGGARMGKSTDAVFSLNRDASETAYSENTIFSYIS